MHPNQTNSQNALIGAADPENHAAAAVEWIGEISEILAAGLMRALARKSSGKPPETGESSLDLSAGESGDPSPTAEKHDDR